MTTDEELAHVVRLACLVEDRAPEEQRALINVAHRLDMRRSRLGTISNPSPVPPTLLSLVVATYRPEGRYVGPTRQQREQHERRLEEWIECDRCGHRKGLHYADDRCPTPTIRSEPR